VPHQRHCAFVVHKFYKSVGFIVDILAGFTVLPLNLYIAEESDIKKG